MPEKSDEVRIPPAELFYREAVAHLEWCASNVTDHVPALVPHARGDMVVHRVPTESVDAVFALKLIQVVGNLKSGGLLIEHGFYHEWDMVSRLLYETLDDVKFLAHGERRGMTPLHRRYLAAFFAEDFDASGAVLQDRVRAVSRRDILDYLETATDEPEELRGLHEEQLVAARNMYRLRSASVHGRAAGIIRGYYEAEHGRFWTTGPRFEPSMGFERFALHVATLEVIFVFGFLIGSRWWGEDHRRQAASIALRLQAAVLRAGRAVCAAYRPPSETAGSRLVAR